MDNTVAATAQPLDIGKDRAGPDTPAEAPADVVVLRLAFDGAEVNQGTIDLMVVPDLTAPAVLGAGGGAAR